MSDCKINNNQKKCNCSYSPCSRKGICCDCLTYHKKNGELPACYFPNDVEKAYDRSVENFIKTFEKRGICW